MAHGQDDLDPGLCGDRAASSSYGAYKIYLMTDGKPPTKRSDSKAPREAERLHQAGQSTRPATQSTSSWGEVGLISTGTSGHAFTRSASACPVWKTNGTRRWKSA